MRALLLIAALATACSDPGRAEEPWQTTRALEALQNRAARGDDTRVAQDELIRRASRAFRRLKPAVWREPRNARAAIVFVLGGGDPGPVAALASFDPPPLDPDLIKGVFAHVTGRSAEARRLLGPIAPDERYPTLAAHVALAKATLVMPQDPAVARGLLMRARTLMPGTLVAEAATRRELEARARLDDLGGFVSLSQRHFHAFPDSIYGPVITEALPRLWLTFDPAKATTEKLKAFGSALPGEMTTTIYADVARGALIQGRFEAAAGAADLAAGAGGANSRAAIYAAASNIGDPSIARLIAALQAIEPQRLSRIDRALRLAALEVGGQVLSGDVPLGPKTAEPETGGAEAEQAPWGDAEAGPETDRSDDSPVLIRGTALIRDVDRILAAEDAP